MEVDLAKTAKKAGSPRVENNSEMMTESAKSRYDVTQPSVNHMLHGRPVGTVKTSEDRFKSQVAAVGRRGKKGAAL